MKSPFLFSLGPKAARAAAAPPGAPSAGGPSGLVKLKTSHTLNPHTVEIDRDKARLTRMRRSLTWAAGLIHHALGPLRYRPAMLTLTYRDVDGFKACLLIHQAN